MLAIPITDRMAQSDLTPREHQTLQLVAKGLTIKEIGRVSGTSDKDVTEPRSHIIEKLDVFDRTEAATNAVRQGLVSFSD